VTVTGGEERNRDRQDGNMRHRAHRNPLLTGRHCGSTVKMEVITCCGRCGLPLPEGQRRRFCSNACRQAAYRRRRRLRPIDDAWRHELLTFKEAARLLPRILPPNSP
jgi:predicted nucleic acid-binding Zn ribbon protein